jgi:hypothetical protein
MPYTFPFDPTQPTDASPATVDDDMRAIKAGIEERFNDLFGIDMSADDPIVPTKIGPALQIQANQIGTNIFNAGNSGASLNINWNNGDQQIVTLTANCTFTFSNVVAGRNYILYLVQNGTGGFSATFPAGVRSSNNTNFGTPALTTTANRLSIIGLFAYTSSIAVGTIVATGVNVS